jgi:hypothetical protein
VQPVPVPQRQGGGFQVGPPSSSGSSGGSTASRSTLSQPASLRITGATFKDEQAKVGEGRVNGNILTMQEYETKGAQRLTAYQQTLKAKTPDITASTDVTKLKPPQNFFDIYNPKMPAGLSPYKTKTTPLKGSATDNFPELKVFTKEDLGFEITPTSKVKETRINNHDDPEDAGWYIVRGTHSEDGKFMVHQDAFKENDDFAKAAAAGTAKDPQKRVPANEMSYQSFKSVAGPNSKNMQAQFLTNIYNPGMWRIIQESYKARGIPLNTKATWTAKDNPQEFNRFTGSDNANGKIQALQNHHDDMGNKNLVKIVTVPRDVPGSQGKLTVALIFA